MRNALCAELMKTKKNRIFLVCSSVVWFTAAFIVVKDLFWIGAVDDSIGWIFNSATINLIVLPIMSGFVITFMMQREYQDHTIINVMAAPTPRATFLLSKLLVWLFWYMLTLIGAEVICGVGAYLLYPGIFGMEHTKAVVVYFTKSGLLAFVAYLPLLWVAVLQKKIFYPSVMVLAAFSLLLMASMNLPDALAAILPWSAVLISLFDVPVPFATIGMVSILTTGVLGLALSYFSFSKQDQ